MKISKPNLHGGAMGIVTCWRSYARYPADSDFSYVIVISSRVVM